MIKTYAPIFSLYTVYFLDIFGLAVAFPVFAALQNAYQLPFPILIISFPLMQMLSWPYFARLGAKWGRKYALNLSLFFIALFFALTALGAFLKSFPLLLIGRLASGAFSGSFILAVVPPLGREHKGVHLYHRKLLELGGTGLILGVFLGTVFSNTDLSPSFHIYTPFIFTAFFALVALPISTYSLTSDPSLDPWQEKTAFFSWKAFRKTIFKRRLFPLFLIFFLFQMAWITNLEYFSMYLEKTFAKERTFALFILVGMTLACLIGLYMIHYSLNRVLGRKRLLQFSLAGGFFFHFATILTANFFVKALFHIGFSLYVGVIWSCIGSHIVTEDLRAEYQLVAYKMITLIMAALGGAIFSSFFGFVNIYTTYLFGSLCLLLGLIFSFKIEN